MGAVLSPPTVGVAETLLDAPPMPRVAVVKLKPETGNNNPSLSIAPLTVTGICRAGAQLVCRREECEHARFRCHNLDLFNSSGAA